MPAPMPGSNTRVVRRRIVVKPANPLASNPIPGTTARQDAETKIHEIYAADYADTSFNARRALSQRLIAASADTKKDNVAKFVLLREARDVSAAVGDVTTAFEAIDLMSAAFPIIKLNDRAEVLKTAAPVLSTNTARLAAISMCMDLTDQSVVEGDYARAAELLSVAESLSRAARNAAYLKWVETHSAEIAPLRDAYERARPAETTLAVAPGEPEANRVMGRFVAFTKKEWDAGLTMLAKGSDPVLAALADADLDSPETAADQFRMADRWWQLAEKESSDDRDAMRQRAGFWYSQCLAALDGLDRALVQRRLQEIHPSSGVKRTMSHPPDALLLTKNRYRASIAEVSWETAVMLCEQAGGRLVSIETRTEGELMTRLARGRKLWVGGEVDANGRWNWLSGGPMFYTNWSAGEPGKFTPEFHPQTTAEGPWITSNGKAGFICEFSD